MTATIENRVRWAELMPADFLKRLDEKPLVYLPFGLCEPHGHISPFGLDTLKADYLCDKAARRYGGIVAPTQAYHIHETGPQVAWLKEVMGGVNPRMGALPPEVILKTFLYQLRSFVNAGFRQIIAISGHHGGNQVDLRFVASEFTKEYKVAVMMHSDPELTEQFSSDHAGKYEISQLLHVRPDLMDMSRVGRTQTDPLGRFAQNPDAHEATAEYGEEIIEAQLEAIGGLVAQTSATPIDDHIDLISMDDMKPIWARIEAESDRWVTHNP